MKNKLPNSLENQKAHRGCYKTRKIPHLDFANYYQFITYRLIDSLPISKVKELKTIMQLELESKNKKPSQNIQNLIKLEKFEFLLNSGYGSCILKIPECAKTIVEAWNHFDGIRYNLVAWVVMPNHVHVLIKQYSNNSLAKIILSWKNYTARMINKLINKNFNNSIPQLNLCRTNKERAQNEFWARGYWDRYIRNEEDLNRTIQYIHYNPVKAGLTASEIDWPWSSAKIYMDTENLD